LRDDTGLRLVNVAFTRTRGKLILIADKNWCAKAMLIESNALLKQLILADRTVARIDVLPSPDIYNQSEVSLGCRAEELLWDALCRRSDVANVQSGFILLGSDGTPIVSADLAYPHLKFAIYIDGPRWNLLGEEWRRDWWQRHRLVDMGWAFAVFSVAEVHEDTDACA